MASKSAKFAAGVQPCFLLSTTGMGFIEGLDKSFADVPTAPGVATADFLQASEGLVKLFDLLGSSAFKVVQSDLRGNIEKIKARQLAHPAQSATLEDLVTNEVATDKKRPATQGLLWLTRGLEFTAIALRRNLSDASEELAASFSKAYENSLKQFHSFVVRPIFALAMKGCPYRADFYQKLDSPSALIEVWLAALERIVAQIKGFLTPDVIKGL